MRRLRISGSKDAPSPQHNAAQRRKSAPEQQILGKPEEFAILPAP
jgi:hypothetical protein